MRIIRRGLRDRKLGKDTYRRLTCSECDEPLKKKNDPDEVFLVRICANCECEWKELR